MLNSPKRWKLSGAPIDYFQISEFDEPPYEFPVPDLYGSCTKSLPLPEFEQLVVKDLAAPRKPPRISVWSVLWLWVCVGMWLLAAFQLHPIAILVPVYLLVSFVWKFRHLLKPQNTQSILQIPLPADIALPD